MIDESISLYKRCFSEDPDDVTDVVFSKRLSHCPKMEKRVDGKLASVLFLVEKKMLFYGTELSVPHVVGLCTDPQFRKRGYARELLQEVLKSLSGVPFITLYPFLHAFYEKLGFATVSFDAERPKNAEKTSADTEVLLSLYRDFCAPLEYCFLREKEDFAFYKAVNAPFFENYALLNGGRDGFSSPDEYIPRTFDRERHVLPGVMARICDLSAVEKLPGVDLSKWNIVDPLSEKNNRFLSPDKETLTIGKVAEKVFFREKTTGYGYLADRY